MAGNFSKIAIIGRDDDPRISEPLESLGAHLTKAGVEVLREADAEQAELLIAIGGDGTMLYAGRLAHDHDIPILGINRGRLGFLADITPDDMITRRRDRSQRPGCASSVSSIGRANASPTITNEPTP